MTEQPVKETPTNKINLSSVRMSQDFVRDAPVQEILSSVPVRKPKSQEWVRNHESDNESIDVFLLEDQQERELYLVSSPASVELAAEIKPFRLFRSITRTGTEFLWPVRLPGPDGKSMAWWDTALQASEMAQTDWVRMTPDMSLGAYRIVKTEVAFELSPPQWSSNSFDDLVNVAFSKDRFIESADHPFVQRLLGKV